jgi:hypothetical protein
MRQIFPPEHELLSARIARLCVLHEDLRIELYGIEAETLERLDIVSAETRRHYFLRRSIATLHEFSEGIRMLDEFPDFSERVRSRFTHSQNHRWRRTVQFFERIDKTFRLVRNDVGGHFGFDAALYAVRNMNADSVGSIAEMTEWRTSQPKPVTSRKIMFAPEIAATTFFRYLPGATKALKARYFFKKLLMASRRAIVAVDLLVEHSIFDRLGK